MSSQPPSRQGHQQRSIKNYLLDPSFQLKYTGYLVLITLALSGVLGLLLWRTGNAVLEQSGMAVTHGLETVQRGQDLVKESQKVSAVVKMNIAKEYADQPDLANVFNGQSDTETQRLVAEQHRLESDAARLAEHAKDFKHRQTEITAILFFALSALVLLVGAMGIVITHKIAGPIFKMKRQLRELGEGHLRLPAKLRKGDELVHFFEAFEKTVHKLRARREAQLHALDSVLSTMEAQDMSSSGRPLTAPAEHEPQRDTLAALRVLRAELQAELE